jgi:hypothetical protein
LLTSKNKHDSDGDGKADEYKTEFTVTEISKIVNAILSGKYVDSNGSGEIYINELKIRYIAIVNNNLTIEDTL